MLQSRNWYNLLAASIDIHWGCRVPHLSCRARHTYQLFLHLHQSVSPPAWGRCGTPGARFSRQPLARHHAEVHCKHRSHCGHVWHPASQPQGPAPQLPLIAQLVGPQGACRRGRKQAGMGEAPHRPRAASTRSRGQPAAGQGVP